jgi:hypothetical protein
VISYLQGLPSKFVELGRNILNGLWDGLKSIWEDIAGWFTGIWDWVLDKIGDIKDGMSDAQDAANSADGHHASGLDYVPHNGYRAVLHEGERVLTAEENRKYQNGSGGGPTFIFNSPVPLTEIECRRQMLLAQRDAAMKFE